MLYGNISVRMRRVNLGIKILKLAICKYFILCIFKRKRIYFLTSGPREVLSLNLAENELKSVPFYSRKTHRNSQRVHFRLTY